MNNRKSKDEYYLNIAKAVLECSTCLRRKYGAVIVRDDEIISTGYNGSPRGDVNCCEVGYCFRQHENIPHGERYEAYRSVHAEMNAIISASRRDMIGSTLYLAGIQANGSHVEDIAPCSICQRLIVNSGILFVVTRKNDGSIHRKEINHE